MQEIVLIGECVTMFYLYLFHLTLLMILYLEKLMRLNEFLVIADITIKMLSYTHLIRIRTNNNHLKILSWLKYKSFHVYGTLKIFHLFSRKKDEYAWTLTTDWINIVSPSPSSSLLLSVSPSFIIVHSWTNHVRCIH